MRYCILVAALLTTSTFSQTTTTLTEEQIRTNASLAYLEQQRNTASSQVAVAAGQIAVLEAQLKAAKESCIKEQKK